MSQVRPGAVAGSRFCLLRAGFWLPAVESTAGQGDGRSVGKWAKDLFERLTGNARQEGRRPPSECREERVAKWIVHRMAPRTLSTATSGTLVMAFTIALGAAAAFFLFGCGVERRGCTLRVPLAAESLPTRILVHDTASVSSSGVPLIPSTAASSSSSR